MGYQSLGDQAWKVPEQGGRVIMDGYAGTVWQYVAVCPAGLAWNLSMDTYHQLDCQSANSVSSSGL